MITAYWHQIKIFYKAMWIHLFARERNLDGDLQGFILKEGFFWEWMRVHVWLVRGVWITFRNLVQLILCYLSAAIMLVIMLIAPALIVIAFPVFAIKRHRRLKREASFL